MCLYESPLSISRSKRIHWAEKCASHRRYTWKWKPTVWWGADFSSVSLDNCLFSVLPTARLWCLMKLLPQWHVTSEVTEGLPQWGQSVWDNCSFTIGPTFMVLRQQWFWPGAAPAWRLIMSKLALMHPAKSCVPCIFPPELGSGPLYMDHPLAMYTVCGSDLGADWGEWLLCTGCVDSTGHHPGLALTEDGTTPVGKHYTAMHVITNI